MAAKGNEAKSKITKKILETFGNSAFIANGGKEIRINEEENGELIQIKLTLTASKTPISQNGEDISSQGINFESKNIDIEMTSEEKENIADFIKRIQ